MPDHDIEIVIHTLSLLGVVGGLLASTTLSKRCQKGKLREMANSVRLCLPVNATTHEANMIRFGEKDKAVMFYLNIDPLVILAKIMGMMVKRLLIDSGAFCNILFKKIFNELDDYHDYVEPSEHIIWGFGDATVRPMESLPCSRTNLIPR